jgi:hypothetical protein
MALLNEELRRDVPFLSQLGFVESLAFMLKISA